MSSNPSPPTNEADSQAQAYVYPPPMAAGAGTKPSSPGGNSSILERLWTPDAQPYDSPRVREDQIPPREPRARKERPSILVEVDIENLSGVVEAVHHPVSVVGVDIDVRYPVPLLDGPSHGDRHVVEDAEAARALRVGVVEPAGRMKGGSFVFQGVVDPLDRALRDPRCGLVATGEGRRVARIEQQLLRETARALDELEVLGSVERLEHGTVGHFDRPSPSEGALRCLRHHRFQQADRETSALLGERMVRAEIVVEEPVGPDHMRSLGRHAPITRLGGEVRYRSRAGGASSFDPTCGGNRTGACTIGP